MTNSDGHVGHALARRADECSAVVGNSAQTQPIEPRSEHERPVAVVVVEPSVVEVDDELVA